MDNRQEEAAARRRRYLDAAIDVLGEVGADRLTMEAVAERADAATRTLYNHFSSRDDLIAEALSRLLQDFRDTLDLKLPNQGDPAERLRSFVRLLYNTYDRQGSSLATLLDHRDDPQIDAQFTEQRRWRRDQLHHILLDAKAELLLPLPQALALAVVLTNHASWTTLVREARLTQPKAIALTSATLEAVLFGHRPLEPSPFRSRTQL
jgi:AcrR family transcriptional regulator